MMKSQIHLRHVFEFSTIHSSFSSSLITFLVFLMRALEFYVDCETLGGH